MLDIATIKQEVTAEFEPQIQAALRARIESLSHEFIEKAEQAVRESEELVRSAQENLTAAVAHLDLVRSEAAALNPVEETPATEEAPQG